MTPRVSAGMAVIWFSAWLPDATRCASSDPQSAQAEQEGDASPEWRIATCESGSAYGYWSCSNFKWSSTLEMNWSIFPLPLDECCIAAAGKCIVLPTASVVVSGEGPQRTMKFIGWGDDGGDAICTIRVQEIDD